MPRARELELKVHLLQSNPPTRGFSYPDHVMVKDARATTDINQVTCRICRFHYLSKQATWAKDFLLDLKAAAPNAKTSENARLKGCKCRHDTSVYGHLKPCPHQNIG